jgi:type I restriction enzyme S subunit
MPEVQQMIIDQASPMTAKMKSKVFRVNSRPDWLTVRVPLMRWCLRVKLAQNWNTFGPIVRSTGDSDIVEESRKDMFWGAKPMEDNTLYGANVLGILLVELRAELRSDGEPFRTSDLHCVQPPPVPGLLLLGEPVGALGAPPLPDTAAAEPSESSKLRALDAPNQPSLWD